MHRLSNKKTFVAMLIATPFLIFCFYSLGGGAQTIEWIKADPNYVILNASTTTTIKAKVAVTPTLISNSVNLIRCDATGKALVTLGTMYDNGTHGDAVAGDNVFSTQVTFTEAESGAVYLKASAAYTGLLKRVFSRVLQLAILVSGSPEETLASVVFDLRQGNIDKVKTKFAESPKITIMDHLDTSAKTLLADWIQRTVLIRQQDGYRVYRTEWIDDENISHDLEFIMIKNDFGEWKIIW